ERARADPLRPAARPRGAPGGHLRRPRPDPLDPPRLDRPLLLHARRAVGDPEGRLARALADDRPRTPALKKGGAFSLAEWKGKTPNPAGGPPQCAVVVGRPRTPRGGRRRAPA